MKIFETAFAKINIFLDVTRRMPDGYHEIKSVMQTVDLSDRLEMDCRRSEHTEISISVEGGDAVPADENNLVCRAVLSYLRRAGMSAEVRIRLYKRIPVGAGLGGGSADAAAALRGMDRAFSALGDGELAALASEIGSDVTFCLSGGTALCLGRGERIETAPAFSGVHTVVAIGEGRVSTPAAYRALDALYNDFADGAPTVGEERFSELWSALESGRIPVPLYNIFEDAVVPTLPEIAEIKSSLLELGAVSALMSGSGSAVFGFFSDEASARAAARALSDNGVFAEYAKTV